jgi:hypothetical protein
MNKLDDRVVFDSEVSHRRILIVPIHTIKPTPYNPAPRTKEGAALNRLVEAIRTHGLVYPILITADRELADGNRRLMACRILGYTHIDCIVSDIDRDDLFSTVNATPMPMASRGWLEIARGGRKVPAVFAAQYKELLGLIGTYGIDILIKNGLGMNSLHLCKNVVSLDAKYILPELIMNVAKGKLTNKINFILRSGKSREEKVSSIDELLFSYSNQS